MDSCQHPHNAVSEEKAVFQVTSDEYSLERTGTNEPIKFLVEYCTDCQSILETAISDAYPLTRLNEVVETEIAGSCPHSWGSVIATDLYIDVLDTEYLEANPQKTVEVAICTDCDRVLEAEDYSAIPVPLE